MSRNIIAKDKRLIYLYCTGRCSMSIKYVVFHFYETMINFKKIFSTDKMHKRINVENGCQFEIGFQVFENVLKHHYS